MKALVGIAFTTCSYFEESSFVVHLGRIICSNYVEECLWCLQRAYLYSDDICGCWSLSKDKMLTRALSYMSASSNILPFAFNFIGGG